MAKALIIKSNGDVEIENIASLEDLQKAVGGYIELIHFTNNTVAYLNEDGKAQNLPFNKKATELCTKYNVGLMDGDFISGNMVIIGSVNPETGEHDCEEYDIPDDLLTEIINYCFIPDGQSRVK